MQEIERKFLLSEFPDLPLLEKAEVQARGQDVGGVQRHLFSLRSRFRELGC